MMSGYISDCLGENFSCIQPKPILPQKFNWDVFMATLIPISDETLDKILSMVLFETGTFTAFSKEPFFQISLVRQFSNDDEEFYQIHVVILYKPTAENKIFSETTWDEDLDENIFDYIRKSASFAYARNHEYIEIKIYMDET